MNYDRQIICHIEIDKIKPSPIFKLKATPNGQMVGGHHRPVRRPLAGGGQDFEKLEQNLKFPQIVK